MELSKYLLPSHSVEITTSVKDENNKSQDLILRTIIERGFTDGKFNIIAPIYHGKVYNFQIDEQITVTFSLPESKSKDIYAIRCLIVDRNFEHNMSTLTLSVIGSPSKVQRRQAFRVNIFNTYPFVYRDQVFDLVSKDISSTGMLALSPIQLPKNYIFDITFDANIKSKEALNSDYTTAKVFKVRCKIIDSIPQVEIRRYLNRIQFEALTEQDSKHLIQYLYAKQTEILHLDPNSSEKINTYFEHENDYYVDSLSKEYRRLQVISLISFVSLFVSIIMLLFSRPKRMYVLDYFFDFYRPQFWHPDYLAGSMIIAIIVIFIDLIGIGLNFIEIKKNNSIIHWSLIVTLLISLSIIFFVTTIAAANSIPLF